MAKDVDGEDLKVGDTVSIPCTIVEIQEGVDHEITLESAIHMPNNQTPSRFAVHGSQVKLEESA